MGPSSTDTWALARVSEILRKGCATALPARVSWWIKEEALGDFTPLLSALQVYVSRYSLVIRALDSWLDGLGFDSQPQRLVLGWVTVFGRAIHLSITKPRRPTQAPTLSGTGK